jgi:hypothetical protein
MPKVTAPSMMKSLGMDVVNFFRSWDDFCLDCAYHFQPCSPWTLSSVAKVASAMSPENEVAKMLPE